MSTSCPPTASTSGAWPMTCREAERHHRHARREDALRGRHRRGTYRYDVAPNGSLAGKTLAAEQGSDGITLDNEGNLYLTGNGVLVVDKGGRQIAQIEVPDEQWTANVSFGGKDRHTLFITASTGLYAVRMRVKSANAAK